MSDNFRYFTADNFKNKFIDTSPIGRLMPKTFIFRYLKEHDCLILNDCIGDVCTREEIKELIGYLNNFINSTITDEDISNANNENFKRNMRGCSDSKNSESKIKKEKIKGFVYFITMNKKEYKIGMTKDMNTRMGEYTKLPYDPDIIHTIETNDAILTETLFHNLYADKRLRGEWFKLSVDDVRYIKSNNYTKEISDSICGGDK